MGTLTAAGGTLTAVGGTLPDAGGAAFSPLDLTWHTAFYADDITGLVDGDPIAQWDDASGNARHAKQATTAYRPVYRSAVAALNGQPAVEADGVDDFLRVTFATEPQPYTAVAVIRSMNTAQLVSDYVYDLGAGSSAQVVLTAVDAGRMRYGTSGGVVTSDPGVNVASPMLAVFEADGAASRFLVNGTDYSNGTSGTVGASGVTLFNAITSGAAGHFQMGFFGLYVGKFSSTELSDLFAWSQSKYGTP